MCTEQVLDFISISDLLTVSADEPLIRPEFLIHSQEDHLNDATVADLWAKKLASLSV